MRLDDNGRQSGPRGCRRLRRERSTPADRSMLGGFRSLVPDVLLENLDLRQERLELRGRQHGRGDTHLSSPGLSIRRSTRHRRHGESNNTHCQDPSDHELPPRFLVTRCPRIVPQPNGRCAWDDDQRDWRGDHSRNAGSERAHPRGRDRGTHVSTSITQETRRSDGTCQSFQLPGSQAARAWRVHDVNEVGASGPGRVFMRAREQARVCKALRNPYNDRTRRRYRAGLGVAPNELASPSHHDIRRPSGDHRGECAR